MQIGVVKHLGKFMVLIERDEEGYYVATVPALRELPYAGQKSRHTDEARS
jgi:hypothetical protein